MKNSDFAIKTICFRFVFFSSVFCPMSTMHSMYKMHTFELCSQFTIRIAINSNSYSYCCYFHAFISYPRFTMSIWNFSNSQICFHSINSFFPLSLSPTSMVSLFPIPNSCSRDNYFIRSSPSSDE